jgi:hypothetical protein
MRAGRSGMAALVVLALVAFMSVGTGTSSASAIVGCPAHGPVACVDRTDSGHSVHMRVGRTLRVVLGGVSLRWTGLHQIGPVVLRLSHAMVRRDGGIMATYIALKAGHTTLRAGGAPTCERGRACPQFVLLWQVRVAVG